MKSRHQIIRLQELSFCRPCSGMVQKPWIQGAAQPTATVDESPAHGVLLSWVAMLIASDRVGLGKISLYRKYQHWLPLLNCYLGLNQAEFWTDIKITLDGTYVCYFG
jgi:hypothetical protein